MSKLRELTTGFGMGVGLSLLPFVLTTSAPNKVFKPQPAPYEYEDPVAYALLEDAACRDGKAVYDQLTTPFASDTGDIVPNHELQLRQFAFNFTAAQRAGALAAVHQVIVWRHTEVAAVPAAAAAARRQQLDGVDVAMESYDMPVVDRSLVTPSEAYAGEQGYELYRKGMRPGRAVAELQILVNDAVCEGIAYRRAPASG